MKKIIQYMCVAMGALFMLLACQDDAAIINPDVTHGRSTEGVETVNSNWRYKFQVRLDDEEEWYEASSVIVGKSRYYAGRYSLFNGASLCVPQLHVAIFTGDTRADFMRYAAVIAMEALQLDKSIIIRHAQKIEIRCNVEDFAAELDGDAITSAPLQIELHPVPINFLA